MNRPGLDARREVIRVALAAAEVCWVAPLFLVLNERTFPHHPLPIWLGMWVLLLGFSYVYRALAAAELSAWLRQGLLVLALLLSIGYFWRFHVYAGPEAGGLRWLGQPFVQLVRELDVLPGPWIAAMTLIYFWARGIALARRTLSADSVGFSFRLGIVLLMGVALASRLLGGRDASALIVPYFFFALVAVALARVDEVSKLPNSSPVGFSGFWIGSTLAAVAALVLLGVGVAVFFTGGGLRQVLAWLSPVWFVLQVLVAGIGALLLLLIEGVLVLFSVDISSLGDGLREVLQRLGELATFPAAPPPPGTGQDRPPFLAVMQVVLAVGIPLLIMLVVVLLTWQRLRGARRGEGDEARESLLSPGAVGRNLLDMLRSGRDRLGELGGLVARFGVGQRFLSAVSIRRIYANLVRLASRAGYPRAQTQTPYEYLETLYEALPGSEAEVRLITQAYVDAHYGQVPDSREALQRIRDCWERVRARGAAG